MLKQLEEVKNRENNSIRKNISRLEENFKELNFSSDFVERVQKAASELAGRSNPSYETLEQIVKAAHLWDAYIEKSDFSHLVECMILSMYKINTAVLSTHSEFRSYIGNYARLKENVILPDTATVMVNLAGKIYVGTRGRLDPFSGSRKNPFEV